MIDQFFQFVGNHWGLWLLFVGILLLLVLNEYIGKMKGATQLSTNEAVNLINHQGAVVVDLRDDKNYADGHIIGAINIPRSNINHSIQRLNKYKNKPLILACAQGQHAAPAVKQFTQAGIEQLHILKGGIAAWKAANLPLTKGLNNGCAC